MHVTHLIVVEQENFWIMGEKQRLYACCNMELCKMRWRKFYFNSMIVGERKLVFGWKRNYFNLLIKWKWTLLTFFLPGTKSLCKMLSWQCGIMQKHNLQRFYKPIKSITDRTLYGETSPGSCSLNAFLSTLEGPRNCSLLLHKNVC